MKLRKMYIHTHSIHLVSIKFIWLETKIETLLSNCKASILNFQRKFIQQDKQQEPQPGSLPGYQCRYASFLFSGKNSLSREIPGGVLLLIHLQNGFFMDFFIDNTESLRKTVEK